MANVSGVQIDVYNIKSWVCWWAKAMTTAITINSSKNLKGIWQNEQKPQVKVEQETNRHMLVRAHSYWKRTKRKKNDVPMISMWWLMRIWLLLILNAAVVAVYCWWHLIWPFARCQPFNGLIFTTYNKSIDTRLLFTYFVPLFLLNNNRSSSTSKNHIFFLSACHHLHSQIYP